MSSDYESLAFDGEFDGALFFDSLHHAVDEEAALAGAYRALRPGGVLVTHEPGEGHAANPATQAAVARYGVTEKDMPPRRIVEIARRTGFAHGRILLNTERMVRFGMGIGEDGLLGWLARQRAAQPVVAAAMHFWRWGRLGSMVVLVK